jgi:hypothetical protein
MQPDLKTDVSLTAAATYLHIYYGTYLHAVGKIGTYVKNN